MASSSNDTPAEANSGGDVGGQPNTPEQPHPSEQPAVLPPTRSFNVLQSGLDAPTPQRPNGNGHSGDDSPNAFTDQDSDSVPAPWVGFPSSPPQRTMSETSTTSSPSPSEKAFREDETSAWIEEQTLRSSPRLSPAAAPHSQYSDYPRTIDEGLLSSQGSAAGTPPSTPGDGAE